MSTYLLADAKAAVARLGAFGFDIWELLTLALEVKVAIDYLSNVPPGGPPAPPVQIPDGPGALFNIVVSKVPSVPRTSSGTAMPPIAGGSQPPGTPDLLFEKTVEFTNDENVTLTVWLALAQKGDLALAGDVLRNGLLAEHYRSLLSEDPGQITIAQSAKLTQLRNTLRDFIAQANRQLSSGYSL